jgi:hypothetical protein
MAEDYRVSSTWNMQTQNLLNQLKHGLVKTIKAWRRFSSDDGDIGYFLDASVGSLRSAIQEKFDELEVLQGRLEPLEKICEGFGKVVS